MERKGALEIPAEGETGLGDNAVRAFSKRRENAQKRRLGGMKKRIVSAQGQSSDGFENLFALSGQAGCDIGRQAIGPMAGYADLNDQAWPRRRA